MRFVPAFGDYIVFVDESGDHSLSSINPEYPVFVLAFCVFEKREYAEHVCPAVANLKFEFFGHDSVILHEHGIRKQEPPFVLLKDRALRARFLERLSGLMVATDFVAIACAIHKHDFRARYAVPENPYHLAMGFGLERLGHWLLERGQAGRPTHIVCEKRGAKEDADLQRAFRRVCQGQNATGQTLSLELVMADKQSNSAGLQFSDLIARPIGRHVLDPAQPNRAWDIIATKFRRSPAGKIEGWGLKVFP